MFVKRIVDMDFAVIAMGLVCAAMLAVTRLVQHAGERSLRVLHTESQVGKSTEKDGHTNRARPWKG